MSIISPGETLKMPVFIKRFLDVGNLIFYSQMIIIGISGDCVHGKIAVVEIVFLREGKSH